MALKHASILAEEQAHAFELGSLCEDAAFSAIERLSEQTVVQLVKGLRTFYKAEECCFERLSCCV